MIAVQNIAKIQEFPELNEDSIVFVIGGFSGRHAQYYVSTHNCRMYIFEPQAGFKPQLEERFRGNPKVHVYPFGLGEKSGIFTMGKYGTDGAGFVPTLPRFKVDPFEGMIGQGELRVMGDFLKENKIDHIDLILMNCEGYEYRLLPHLIEIGFIPRVRYLLVQFHPHVEGCEREGEIIEKIGQTHNKVWDARPPWCRWEHKSWAQ